MRLAALICVFLSGAALAAPSRLLVARGDWAAFDRGQACEAMAKPVAEPRGRDGEAYVAIAFDRGGPRQGQLFAQLRRTARSGSTAMLTIGERPFLLAVRESSAWSRNARQEAEIISAMRSAGGMRLESRDSLGRRMVDRYVLRGAPVAIDAAAAACSRPR